MAETIRTQGVQGFQHVKWGYIAVRYCTKIANDVVSIVNLAEADLLYPKNRKKLERHLTTKQLECTHPHVMNRSNQYYSATICVGCGIRLAVDNAPTIESSLPWSGQAGKQELRALLRERPLPYHHVAARPSPPLHVASRPSIPHVRPRNPLQSHSPSLGLTSFHMSAYMRDELRTLVAQEVWTVIPFLQENGDITMGQVFPDQEH